MSTPADVSATAHPAEEPEFLGWRYLRRELPDGTVVYDEVPLKPEDFLYPQEDDRPVYRATHTRDCVYLHTSLSGHYQDREPMVGAPVPENGDKGQGILVFCDMRTQFALGALHPLGPDVEVLEEVRSWNPTDGTFDCAARGGRPVLVVEVTSPSTRHQDWDPKLDWYYRVGVEVYVIVDRGPRGEDPPRLEGYRRGPAGWLTIAPDAQGRIDLNPVPFLLEADASGVWLVNPVTGQRLPDPPDLARRVNEMEARLEQEAQARVDAEAQARNADLRRADAEAQARNADLRREEAEAQTRNADLRREEAEAQTREAERLRADAEARIRLEAQARAEAEGRIAREAEARAAAEKQAQEAERLRQAEAQARADAEAKVREEAQARADAEARIAQEAQARADLERQLAQLQALLAQRPPMP